MSVCVNLSNNVLINIEIVAELKNRDKIVARKQICL